MKKIFLFALIASVILSLPISSTERINSFSSTFDGIVENPTFLIAGVDNAAENTDFIMLAMYDADKNCFNFLQVPRDTYCGNASPTGKLNGIFSAERGRGNSSYDAMIKLSDFIGDNFGIRIDGFASYNIASLERLVDNVGGIELNMPYPLEIKDSSDKVLLSLSQGINRLDGRMSMIFIRHRKSYKSGDLGRLDAQKIFLSALLDSFKSEMGIELAARFILDRGEGVTTNLKIADFLNLMLKNKGRIRSVSVNLATMPGQPVIDANAISYYSFSRSANIELITKLGFSSIKEFDSNFIFRKNGDAAFEKIYDSPKLDYKIYDGESIKDLKPL